MTSRNKCILSFIIPCYNVEKYIQRCLDSIYLCGLSEKQYEIVCIDDCSPDRTIDILSKNRTRHNNIRIIQHKINKGLGGARNTGIREAIGQYLWFIDSDDEIKTNGFRGALDYAIKENLDVLSFNYSRINEEGKELSRHIVFEDTKTIDGYAFVKSVFDKNIVYHMGYVVRFLYRTEFLRCNELYFPEQVHWEDTVFMPKSLLLAQRVASISDVLYAYRINTNSISSNYSKAYPAKSIYDYAFCAGIDLLLFSNEVTDPKLSRPLKDSAINKYINGFTLPLLRTNKKERVTFYLLIEANRLKVKPLYKYMNILNKCLLFPFAGPIIADCLSFAYQLKHKYGK